MALVETWTFDPPSGNKTVVEEIPDEQLLAMFIHEPRWSKSRVYAVGSTIYASRRNEADIEVEAVEAVLSDSNMASSLASAVHRSRGQIPYRICGDSWVPGNKGVTRGTSVTFVGLDSVQVGNKVFKIADPAAPFDKDIDLLHPDFPDRIQGHLHIGVDPGYLVGKIVRDVQGLQKGTRHVHVVTDEGTMSFVREQQCCEHVELLDFEGVVKHLVGKTVRTAEVRYTDKGDTFYEIRTDGDDLWLRFGDSDDSSMYGTEIECHWEPSK